jgi:hypothetical protein
MGLRREYLDYIETSIISTVGGLQGKRMLELGNQRIGRRQGIRERTGKAYYTRLGIEHTSVDFNGKDGAVPLDLGTPDAMQEWNARFDIISNLGTTEHVEPFAAQYECFANVHRWLKAGGVAVHIVPAIEELEATGRWQNHCNNYYSKPFFEMLARESGCELVSTRVINELRAACLHKTTDRPFMGDRELFLRQIHRTKGGIVYFGAADGRRWHPRNLFSIFLRKVRQGIAGRR